MRTFVSVWVWVLSCGLLFFSGCNAPKSQLSQFNNYFISSDYNDCVLFGETKISNKPEPRGEDLLWTLQLGAVERIRKNYEKSTEYFDKSEEMLKFFDEKGKLGDAVGSVLVNDNVAPYKGDEYDGVMVNVYKALNFMSKDNMDFARVEFNRALDRQRRAKIKFNEEIKKLKAELNQENNKSQLSKSNVENPKTQELLLEKYPNLYDFEAYPDFVNPFATYMAALYFNLVGDHAKAVDLLKESCGMVQDNEYIIEDLAVTEEILNGSGGRLTNTVWLIFENGLGPVKSEFRLDLPLFIATSKIKYVGIALPKLEFRDAAFPYLVVRANGKSYKTSQVASIDRIVQTEFSKNFSAILTRAIISTTAKAVAQYALSENNSSAASLASVFVAAYSFVTTAADVRIWTVLPKDFQVARFEKPADGKLEITAPGGMPLDIDIEKCNNAIVYVKIPTSLAVPVCDVITF
ncbi:MAG: hypothetical protein ISS77_02420 [Phycisphaerae bacterium]|nr:hypothetical protein [Phycisphaerae bacterium]